MKIKESELKAIIAEVIKDVIEDNSKVNEGNMKRMAIEIMDELQIIMDRYGIGVEALQGILQDMTPMAMNEGFLDTLRNLLSGAEPTELELAQREVEKAMEMLSTPSLPTGMGKPRKPPMDARRDRELQLKLAKLKRAHQKAKGAPISPAPLSEMYGDGDDAGMYGGGGMSPEHNMINEKIFEVVELLYENGSDPELTDAYIALMRALSASGVNLRFLMMSI